MLNKQHFKNVPKADKLQILLDYCVQNRLYTKNVIIIDDFNIVSYNLQSNRQPSSF